MKTFFQRLEDRVNQIDSILCIGLDPHPAEVPSFTRAGLVSFCRRLIEATIPYAAAYKPNAAFFEQLGAEGWLALEDVLALIPDEIPVILDAKRGDIASTADAYAASAFGHFHVDAITLNAYLGKDSVDPFLKKPENGAFILCKTSNPSAAEFQNLIVSDGQFQEAFYVQLAKKVQTWDTASQIGLVAGATHIDSLRKIREAAPQTWILAPGVGAQGADLSEALRAGLRPDGLGMLMPVSRGISKSDDPARAAQTLCREINLIREQIRLEGKESQQPVDRFLPLIGDELLHSGCVKFGNFTLKSGLQSPIYIDLRRLISYPSLLNTVCEAYTACLKKLEFDRIAGLPYAALPIATLISQKGNWPMIYPRKETKEYGTKASIEGDYNPGERIVILDDLATTGGSKFEAIEKLCEANLIVKDVVVLIDRQSGAAEALAEQGYQLHAVLQFKALLQYWHDTQQVPEEQIQAVYHFLETH